MAQYGTITLDGSLADWGVPVYDDGAGHKLFARYQDGYYVFAATGVGSTGADFWLNTDRDGASGFQEGGPAITQPATPVGTPGWPTSPYPHPPTTTYAPFAGGAEYGVLVRPPEAGGIVTRLGAQLDIPQAWNGDTVEFALPASAIGANLGSVDFKVRLGFQYLDSVFTAAPVQTYGGIALDGGLGDWDPADERSVNASYAPPGSRFFATAADGAFVFALKTTDLATAGARILIDSDRNDATGSTFNGVYNESLVKFPPGGSYYPIAKGVDFDIRFDAAGHPQLYKGDGTLLGPLAYAVNGDTIELAVQQSVIGGVRPADVTLEFFNGLYGVGYVPPTFTVGKMIVGGITLDGSLADWNPADERPVNATYSPPGSRFLATAADGAFVFALKTSDLANAGAHILIDSDRDDTTGSTAYGSVNESMIKLPGGPSYPIAKGVDFDVRFDAAGHPQLYKGDGTLLGPLAYALNGDTIEFAVPQSVMGGMQPADVTLEFFNGAYSPVYVHVPATFTVGAAATVAGGVQLDGNLGDWAPSERIDSWQTGIVGYEIRGKATEDAFVVALKAPTAIGANTTVWINADADSSTGYRIWGFAGGAEYFVNVDASGRPQLFANGGTLVADLDYAYSPDHTVVEFVIPKELVGGVGEINTLYDVNDSVFLPTRYLATQYRISDGAAAPVIGSDGGGETASLTIAENATAVTTVSAAGATHYAILAGVDALAFQIDPTSGALRFVAAPDFEAPTDDDGNNRYEVTVAAVDAAGHSDVQQLKIAVADVAGLTLTGDKRANVLAGGAENDTLSGAAGNDTLRGMAGADLLRGGAGVDTLTGGTGADRFVFGSADEIGNGKTPTGRDVVTDFAVGEDKIDFSAIDASEGARGNQAFAFVGTAAFTGAGQLHLLRSVVAGIEHTVVEGNLNNGVAPEFRLDFVGHLDLTASDFVL